MAWLVVKYLVSAGIVVLVSEFASRNEKLGGFVAALPLITFLTLIWLYIEKQPEQKIANHALYTFWYVIPTLPMFLVFPKILPQAGFWLSLLICIILTILCFASFAFFLRKFGINLL